MGLNIEVNSYRSAYNRGEKNSREFLKFVKNYLSYHPLSAQNNVVDLRNWQKTSTLFKGERREFRKRLRYVFTLLRRVNFPVLLNFPNIPLLAGKDNFVLNLIEGKLW